MFEKINVKMKYCVATGNAEFEVTGGDKAEVDALINENLTKFFNLYLKTIINMMKSTQKQTDEFLKDMQRAQGGGGAGHSELEDERPVAPLGSADVAYS